MILKMGSLKKNLDGRFGKYDFEVGILNPTPYKLPRVGKRGMGGSDIRTTYAGGPVRKKSNKLSGQTTEDVSASLRKQMDINYLTEPFKKRNSDIIRFSNEFFKIAFGKSQMKRAENLLQAIVRNPILRGEYGSNSELTKKIKTFDRFMFDTGQFFRSILARVNKRV